MTLIKGTPNASWFIETAAGLIGPFTDAQEANLVKLSEGHNGTVVQRTETGQSILMG